MTAQRSGGSTLRDFTRDARVLRVPHAQPSADRVAFLASFGTEDKPEKSVVAFSSALHAAGYTVIIVRTSPDGEPWTDLSELDPAIGYIQRSNVGYDFGSWATGMAYFPHLLSADAVLLVNDSLVGPFGDISALLADFESTSADAWSATGTLQFFPHMQSFFVGFRRGILEDAALRKFWGGIRELSHKNQIIEHYEIGLTRYLLEHDYSYTSAIASELVVTNGNNPTIQGWAQLLHEGFPFIKRELLTAERFSGDARAARALVSTLYAENLDHWLAKEVS
ncbi:rhamnan synthesis F family protein [Mycetocola sp. JXN-3]|uniref:rhamnan synthesis F family protein n=1 Tax=Mycetocola sp. JXN-3 TaxID=2116510 RepID=UPI00165D04FF|nr:rhamnan synthesis F family protein [Mycetocola sp. JXN-3]